MSCMVEHSKNMLRPGSQRTESVGIAILVPMRCEALKQGDFRGASLHSSPGNAARMETRAPDFPPGLEAVPGVLGDRNRNRLRDGGSCLRIAEIDFGLRSALAGHLIGELGSRTTSSSVGHRLGEVSICEVSGQVPFAGLPIIDRDQSLATGEGER